MGASARVVVVCASSGASHAPFVFALLLFLCACCFVATFTQALDQEDVASTFSGASFLSFIPVPLPMPAGVGRTDGSGGDLRSGWGWGLSAADGSWTQRQPVQVELVDVNGTVSWVKIPYATLLNVTTTTTAAGDDDTVVADDTAEGRGTNAVQAQAFVTTDAGSNLSVLDTFCSSASSTGNFTVRRTVTAIVIQPNDSIVAFSSRFGMNFMMTMSHPQPKQQQQQQQQGSDHHPTNQKKTWLEAREQHDFFMPGIRCVHRFICPRSGLS